MLAFHKIVTPGAQGVLADRKQAHLEKKAFQFSGLAVQDTPWPRLGRLGQPTHLRPKVKQLSPIICSIEKDGGGPPPPRVPP